MHTTVLALNPASLHVFEVLIGYHLALVRQFLQGLSIIVDLERYGQKASDYIAVAAVKLDQLWCHLVIQSVRIYTHSRISDLSTVSSTRFDRGGFAAL